MKRLRNCQVRIGKVPGFRFAPSNSPGDWLTHFSVKFATPFATSGNPLNPPVRVFVTPVNRKSSQSSAFPIALVESIDVNGFVLNARNSSPASLPYEETEFTYLAISEEPSTTNPAVSSIPPTVALRFGMASPWWYSGQPSDFVDEPQSAILHSRDTSESRVSIAPAFLNDPEVILLTAANLYSDRAAAVAAVVGARPRPNEFEFDSFSADIADGACAFNWVAAVDLPNESVQSSLDLLVDTGWSDDARNVARPNGGRISSAGTDGDWVSRDVYFSQPFSVAPVVLMTARNGPDIAVATNVTPWGFTGSMRNTDVGLASRRAHFDWLAIGCAPNCLSAV